MIFVLERRNDESLRIEYYSIDEHLTSDELFLPTFM